MKIIFISLLCFLISLNQYSQDQKLLPENYTDYPDALSFNDGERVIDSCDWIKRRSELLTLFSNNIYGTFPEDADSLKYKLIEEKKLKLGIDCIFKNIEIMAYYKGRSASFRSLIYIPVSVDPVPVFVFINHRETVSFGPENSIIEGYWPADKIIQNGFATAMLISTDVSPDDKDQYQNGVIAGLFPADMQKANGIKTISAWAWGASRVLDYLETERSVNSEKAAIIGHSRSGKTALWCGANDERFKLVISNNSGNSGSALARRPVGEQVSRINSYFPHWFCDNYNKYDNDVFSLPVDQHMLLSLIAPRALYVASATDDEWADPLGEFYSLNMAVPVYKLFYPDIDYLQLPVDNNSNKSGKIAYHIRKGEHGLELSDWEKYMKFFSEIE